MEYYVGDVVIDNHSNPSKPNFNDLQFFGLYFSASWCRACKYFTPILADVYSKINKDKKIMEIYYIPFDQDQSAFDMVIKHMKWKCIPFQNRVRSQWLMNALSIRYFPALVVMDDQANIITKDGVTEVQDYQEQVIEIWKQKSMQFKSTPVQ